MIYNVHDILNTFPPCTVVGIWNSEAAARHAVAVASGGEINGGGDADWHRDILNKNRTHFKHEDECDKIVIIPDRRKFTSSASSGTPRRVTGVLTWDPLHEAWIVDMTATIVLTREDIDPAWDALVQNPPANVHGPDHKKNVNKVVCAAREGHLDMPTIGQILGTNVNVYPGEMAGGCCTSAYFIALEGPMGRHIHAELAQDMGGGALPWSFARVLAELVQHMRRCGDDTKEAILITDSWVTTEFEKWRPDLRSIRDSGKHLDAYLVGEGRMCIQLW